MENTRRVQEEHEKSTGRTQAEYMENASREHGEHEKSTGRTQAQNRAGN